MLRLFFCLLSASLCAATSQLPQSEPIAWYSMFSLPQHEIDTRYYEVQQEVGARWIYLAADLDFPSYAPDRSDASIVEEFKLMDDLRMQLWFNRDSFPCQSNAFFKLSQELLEKGRFRQPNCISFEHSLTDSSYNSTCIQMGIRRFLALEGPTQENVSHFFRLLANWNTAYVVRLTGEIDGQTPKCYAYWKDRVLDNRLLQIPIIGAYEWSPSDWGTKNVPYFSWPTWEDHHGVKPEELVAAVNLVRKSVKDNEIIAVHCSGGVGRTGTFIAAICLLDAIDEQLAGGVAKEEIQLNISRLFLYLNFHRPWMVSRAKQYLTLYRTVDCYLEHLP